MRASNLKFQNMTSFIKLRTLAIVFLSIFIVAPALAQYSNTDDSLGLPGDNLDLYATLTLFQDSKTIEDFEEELNKEDTGINNLDLDLDGKVDFIKVVSDQDGDDFSFRLQVYTAKDEVQDVAVIFVSKDKSGKVSLQMLGNEDLYGKDYIIEPKAKTKSITANPAYSGADVVVVKSQPSQVVVVESEPIIRYIYSPVYVPYYPPFYWGYYPPYFRPYPVISFNIYWGRHTYYHNNYYGGHRGIGGTVVINDNRTYNNYRSNRNTSNTVRSNSRQGNYTRSNRSSTTNNSRGSNRNSTRTSSTNRSNTAANNRSGSNRSSNTRTSTTTRGGNRSTGTTNRASTNNRSSSRNTNYKRSTTSSNRGYSRPSSSSRNTMNRSHAKPFSKPSRMGGGRRR